MVSRFRIFLLLACLFTIFSGSSSSAKSNRNLDMAQELIEKLSTGVDFSLHVQSDGSLFHRRGEIRVEFSTYQSNGKLCGNLMIKGQGHIFREFKDELEDAADNADLELLEEFFERSSHLQLLETKICYRTITTQRSELE